MKVVLYTKPGCPHCAGAKDDLTRQGIPYTEYDVKGDKARLEEMMSLNGGRRHVPTIVQDGKVTIGFNGY
jgi:glutaredoxin